MPALPVAGGEAQAERLPFREPVLKAARAAAQGAALGTALLGLLGLTGWILHNDALKHVLPGAATPMSANTAVALLALGLSLAAVARGSPAPRRPAAARSGAALAAVISALTLVEYATGTALGIDQLLFRDTALVATAAPGRMALNTAAAVAFAAVATLCATEPRLPAWTAQIPAMAAFTLGMLRFYGFAYHVPQLESFGSYTGMALPTALALVLAGASAFLVRPDEGPAGLLLNAGTTGALGRRLFATTLVVPPLLGWLILEGEDAGLYGMRLGTALLVCGHVSVFSVVIFATLTVGRRIEVAHARAERQVRQNELLQAFMDHTPAAVFVKDLDGRFLAVNTTFEETTGLPPERVLGHFDRDVMPPDFASQARAADLDMLERGGPVQRQDHIVLPGGPRDFLTSLFSLNDRSGRPYAACGVAMDITERVAAQREVQRAGRRFRALLESAPDATLITDGDGTIGMANSRVESLFGHAPDDLVGSRVGDLAPGPQRPRHNALLRRYLESEDPQPLVLDRGLYGLHLDGRKFPVEVSVSTFRAEAERLVFLTVRDITGRRRAEAERAERYEQHRHIAYTLQHSLMGEPPRLPYLPSAHRYLASVQDPGVGGDWFDIVPLDKARTGIVVGDVMGRGLEAAAVMGQLRAASHALARTGFRPRRVMAGLDAFVSDLADQIVTCVYLVIDQEAHQVTLCSAGHPPVIALPPDEHARRLQAPVGVPLGVHGLRRDEVPYQETIQPLRPGSTLALYTDGLVEKPGADVDAQIDVLIRTLDDVLKGSPADEETLDQAADRLVVTLIPDTTAHDDDVTLLLVGLPVSLDPAGLRPCPPGGVP
ncbi:SpoIIE family protein phosphatase [Streptomyces lucensis]|uniref:SpoIIE family protein phosphatase n=1 Tax=Streptomyces lucensis TaxID=67319 RepID=UPI00167C3F63|nr:SpoIIE family protein phosphatase [Streptomyces lucensis]